MILGNFIGNLKTFVMKTKRIGMFMILLIFSVNVVMSQEQNLETNTEKAGEIYLLEREMNDTSEDNLHKIAESAQELVKEIGPQVEWVHSYVTDNKMICVFKYETREALAEHAQKAGLQISDLKKVERIIGPETAKKP